MNERINNEDQPKKKEEGRVIRDLRRRPRSRIHREVVLPTGERKKRTDIGWKKKNNKEDTETPPS